MTKFSDLDEALAKPPTSSGGIAVVFATASEPPAMTLLTTGGVVIVGDSVRCGIHAVSSVVKRLSGAFSLLIPADRAAYRVEAVEAKVKIFGGQALVEGRIDAIRPLGEHPWTISFEFEADDPQDPRVALYVDYWAAVKSWLLDPDSEPPQNPGATDHD